MSERSITSTVAGPITLALELAAGTIHIDCGPHNFTARVTVKTAAETGPSADAIRDAAVRQDNRHLAVRIAGDANGTGGVFVAGDNVGSIGVGRNSGVTVVQSGGETHISGGGRVFVDGVEVTSGDRSSAATPIEVWAYLPEGSASEVKAKSAATHTTGHLDRLDYQSSSGDLHAASVGELDAGASSGTIAVAEVSGSMLVNASSGSIRVGAYSGDGPSIVTASSGSIRIDATPQSRGRLKVTTSSGSIRLSGTAHLDVRHRVSSGSVRIS